MFVCVCMYVYIHTHTNAQYTHIPHAEPRRKIVADPHAQRGQGAKEFLTQKMMTWTQTTENYVCMYCVCAFLCALQMLHVQKVVW